MSLPLCVYMITCDTSAGGRRYRDDSYYRDNSYHMIILMLILNASAGGNRLGVRLEATCNNVKR